MSTDAYVLAPGTGPVLDMGAFRMTIKASAAQTQGGLTILEADEPPGFGPPMHIHDDAGEAFYVLEGEYIFFAGGAQHHCPAGTFVWVPTGVEHGFQVGASASRKLNIFVPAAMEGYFQALAASAAADVPVSQEGYVQLAGEHAMRVTGPPPQILA